MLERHELYVPTKTLVWRISLRITLVTAVVFLVAALWKQVLTLFAPFLLAYLITAWIFAPMLKRFGNRISTARRVWSILLTCLLIVLVLGIVAAVGYYLVVQVIAVAENWNSTQDTLTNAKETLASLIARFTDMSVEAVTGYVDNAIASVGDWLYTDFFKVGDFTNWVNTIKEAVPALVTFLLSCLFFVMAIYFTSADYPRIRQGMSRCVPKIARPTMATVKKAVVSATFGYLRAQLILSGIATLFALVVLLIYGQDFALLIALLAGILDFIPFCGCGVMFTPWSIVLLLQGNVVGAIVLFGLSFVLWIFRKIAEPKVVGDQVGLHPLLSLMSMYVGMRMAGLVGMLLMPIVWMAFINMYREGVFDATIKDVRSLIERIVQKARLPEKNDADEAEISEPHSEAEG